MKVLLTILLACLLAPSVSEAREARSSILHTALRAMGTTDHTIPAAWAGIWEERDSVYVGCDGAILQSTSTDRDTLCVGDSVDPSDVGLTCEGTINDTQFNVTCSSSTTDSGCTATVTYHIVGSRNGNSSVVEATFRLSITPPEDCGNFPDQCTRIVTRSTRLGPAPANCTTPIQPTTWGAIKAIHR